MGYLARPKPSLHQLTAALRRSLALPAEAEGGYAAVHVRHGDKSSEVRGLQTPTNPDPTLALVAAPAHISSLKPVTCDVSRAGAAAPARGLRRRAALCLPRGELATRAAQQR